MNLINTTFATVDKGQLHIAVGENYIGKVNSYNNCFTKLFAWILGRSLQVRFADKVRTVNKRDYTNLLSSLKIGEVKERAIFDTLVLNASISESNGKMREALSVKSQRALGKKLRQAIAKGEIARAILLIGKGAKIEGKYYDRGDLGTSKHCRDGLKKKKSYQFTAFKGTALLHAARKNHETVTRFLLQVGADETAIAEEYRFERAPKSAKKELEKDSPSITFQENPAYQIPKDLNAKPQGYGLKKKAATGMMDSKKDNKFYRLNMDSLTLEEVTETKF